ncbi:HEAT repeat domain-containing protein [Bacteroidota bacterium]
MAIFSKLENNKGTISSAIGKQLAQEVLEGNLEILQEAVLLSSYKKKDKKAKSIRAGAAKIIEVVAEIKPELVSPYLEDLLPALTVDEPQTKWMTIRTMGFYAHLNKKVAEKAIPYADEYITKNDGLCLTSSSDLFLGDFGALSKENAKKVFPILEKSMKDVIQNEQDWIIESCIKIFKNLDKKEQDKIIQFVKLWEEFPRKSTKVRVKKLLKLSEK